MGKNSPGNPEAGDTFIPWHPLESHRSSAKLEGIPEDGIPEGTGLEPTAPSDQQLQKACAQQCLLGPFCDRVPGVRNAPRPNLLLGWEHWNTLTGSGVGKSALLGRSASKQGSTTPLHSASVGTNTAQVRGSH